VLTGKALIGGSSPLQRSAVMVAYPAGQVPKPRGTVVGLVGGRIRIGSGCRAAVRRVFSGSLGVLAEASARDLLAFFR